jgi:hypothetical protein
MHRILNLFLMKVALNTINQTKPTSVNKTADCHDMTEISKNTALSVSDKKHFSGA